jgi:hypothetical protein
MTGRCCGCDCGIVGGGLGGCCGKQTNPVRLAKGSSSNKKSGGGELRGADIWLKADVEGMGICIDKLKTFERDVKGVRSSLSLYVVSEEWEPTKSLTVV